MRQAGKYILMLFTILAAILLVCLVLIALLWGINRSPNHCGTEQDAPTMSEPLPFDTEMTGHYLYCTALDGKRIASMIVVDANPTIMVIDPEKEHMFDGLQNGDEIRILTNGVIRESYPGSVETASCTKLRDGELSDIPEDVLNALSELGWSFEDVS